MDLVLWLLSGLLVLVMGTTAVMVIVVAINFFKDRRQNQSMAERQGLEG